MNFHQEEDEIIQIWTKTANVEKMERTVLMKEQIRYFGEHGDKCGLEVYVLTRTAPRMKKMVFYEGAQGEDNLYASLKKTIIEILDTKYLIDEAEYASADQIADNQKKFYVIEQTDAYKPFAFLSEATGNFKKNDITDATAVVFKLEREGNVLWAYQHLWSIMIPNKTSKGFLGRMVHINQDDVFAELKEPLLTIAKKVDILIITDKIIVSDHKLLQQFFGFQDYIRIRANKTIDAIQAKGIVSGTDKLTEYCNRGNGKLKYAKKMMRIADSKVLKMPVAEMMENIHRSVRWNGKIPEENGVFILRTYVHVELLIDLLDERYTRSDITGEEYDTEVKKKAEPVEQNN